MGSELVSHLMGPKQKAPGCWPWPAGRCSGGSWDGSICWWRAQGAEPLITERKVGDGEVENHAWIGRPHAHLGPLANETVRLIALPLELKLKKPGEIRPQDTVLAKGKLAFCI